MIESTHFTFPADEMDKCDTAAKLDNLLITTIQMNQIRITGYDQVRRAVLIELVRRGKTDLVVAWLLMNSFNTGV